MMQFHLIERSDDETLEIHNIEPESAPTNDGPWLRATLLRRYHDTMRIRAGMAVTLEFFGDQGTGVIRATLRREIAKLRRKKLRERRRAARSS